MKDTQRQYKHAASIILHRIEVCKNLVNCNVEDSAHYEHHEKPFVLFTLYLQTWGGVNGAGAEGGVFGRGFAGKDSPGCGTGAVLTAMIVR